MKTRLIILGLIALPALTFAMSRGANELNGVYIEHHEIMVMPEDADKKPEPDEVPTATVSDQLTITNDTGDGFDFHAELAFSYYHTCDLEGTATLQSRNATGSAWVFRYEQPKKDVVNKRCVMEFAVNNERILLLDPENSCTDWCGARGYFDEAEFSRASKKPLAP